MRPILWDVDDTANPPTMTVAVVGRPLRTAKFEIEHPGMTRDATVVAAFAQLAATDPELIDLLAETF